MKCNKKEAKRFAEFMKAARERKGMSIDEAAGAMTKCLEAAGIKDEEVGYFWIYKSLERESSQPLSNINRIRAACKVYDISFSEVLGLFNRDLYQDRVNEAEEYALGLSVFGRGIGSKLGANA